MNKVYTCNSWDDLKKLTLRDFELILKSAYENGYESDDFIIECISIKEEQENGI